MSTENRKEYSKNYYQSHKEERKKYDERYVIEHAEERKEYNKQYQIEHAEEIKQQRKEYRAKNKEKIRKADEQYKSEHVEETKKYLIETAEIRKEYREAHKKEAKSRNLKKNYNITLEQYDELYNKQEGKCAICGTHQEELKSTLHIDHNHKTKKIRGLLCFKCNSLLGCANDNIIKLESAIIYLKNNN